MPSQTRRFADVGATHQRWYCVCCGTRFRTKFGMLVEVHIRHASTFMLAEVTDKDVEDIRAMYLEKKWEPKDHLHLWELIPDFQPIDPEGVLRPLKPDEKVVAKDVDRSTIKKFVNANAIKSIPKWEWDQIFALMGGSFTSRI